MKVLQLGKFFPIQGGVEKVMYDLMSGLTERYSDIECDMMCVAATPQPTERQISINSTLYCAKLNKKLFSTMLSLDIIKLLKRYCNDYDIIHIHHPDPMVALALKLSGYKGYVVLHWHSDILKQKILLKLYKPLQNWLIKRSDIIIGTSPKYLAESPHLKYINTPKTSVPIGIASIFKNNKGTENLRKTYKGKTIIFALGRLVEYKGFEFLIKAAKYLPDNYLILIGGGGPLKSDLQKIIIDNNLYDKVKLLGRIPDEDLPSYYEGCDVYVMSSIWKTEAFGIVQIEAMSCNKPVVATHIPESGVDWVNKDGFSGLNVPTEDPKAIARAIIDITRDKDTYNEYCTNARKRYEEMFTLHKMVDNVYQIYKEILSNRLKN